MKIFGDSPAQNPLRRTVRHSAYALIFRDGRVAIDEFHAHGRYFNDLPGGGIDWRTENDGRCILDADGRPILESEEEALIREVAEEVCLSVQPRVRLADSVQCYQSSDGRTEVLNYGVLWTAECLGPTLNQPELGHRLNWLHPDEAIEALRHDAHKYLVRRWLEWEQNDHPTPSRPKQSVPMAVKGESENSLTGR